MRRLVLAALLLTACDATAPRPVRTEASIIPAPPITCVLKYVHGVPVDVCTVRHDTL